jgi:aquaporin Z
MDGQHADTFLALPRFIFCLEHQMWRYAAAEYIGTFLLLAVIALVGDPLAIGGALWAAIFLVGKYSGGHFNPAVTAWALLKGKVSSGQALVHVVSQLAAAVTVWKLL